MTEWQFGLQQGISGLAIGSMYALVALGHVLIWNAMGILNFAHGEMVMLGAFLGLTFHVILRLPFWLSFLLVALTGGIIGGLVRRSVYYYMFRKRASGENFLIASIGASVFFINIAILIWGSMGFGFPDAFGRKPLKVAGMNILPRNLWILAIGIVIVIVLNWFLRRTRLGTAMRAVAQDKPTASLMGINVDALDTLTFALASALGAIVGILLAPAFLVTTGMGQSVGLKAFTAAIIGSFESLPGAIIGGLSVGVIENLASAYISSAYKDAVAFVILLIVLIVRPRGLLGKGRTSR
ncbi:MAG: branched-chain amino acid ABC transporter permease [Pseudomonadota bacterium]